MDGRQGGGGVSDFLLELRCEEIPARMQAGARNDLARLFAEGLEAANLDGEDFFSHERRFRGPF